MRNYSQSFNSPLLTQLLLDALRDLRHTVERASTNPEFARDGLSSVLDAVGTHLVRILNQCDREAEAESLSRAIANANIEDAQQPNPLVELLAEVDRLLICIPLDTRPVSKPPRMSKEEAEPKIRAYLKKHPDATQAEIAENVGCSRGTVSSSRPWKAKAQERKAKRTSKPKKIGLDLALNEQARQAYEQNELDKLIEEHEHDKKREDMDEI